MKLATFPSTPKCDNCHNGNSCNNKNTGGCHGCNTCNSTCQTICEVGYQVMSKHPDVGDFIWSEVQKNMLLKDYLTAENWNKLIQNLEKAESIGQIIKQGSAGSATSVQRDEVFYAKYYNEIQQKLSGFEDAYFSPVNKDDLITAARINAIRSAYLNAKFKSNVCDVCNISENRCACNCSCSCSCACTCSCSCGPCSCPCSHPCNCQTNS